MLGYGKHLSTRKKKDWLTTPGKGNQSFSQATAQATSYQSPTHNTRPVFPSETKSETDVHVSRPPVTSSPRSLSTPNSSSPSSYSIPWGMDRPASEQYTSQRSPLSPTTEDGIEWCQFVQKPGSENVYDDDGILVNDAGYRPGTQPSQPQAQEYRQQLLGNSNRTAADILALLDPNWRDGVRKNLGPLESEPSPEEYETIASIIVERNNSSRPPPPIAQDMGPKYSAYWASQGRYGSEYQKPEHPTSEGVEQGVRTSDWSFHGNSQRNSVTPQQQLERPPLSPRNSTFSSDPESWKYNEGNGVERRMYDPSDRTGRSYQPNYGPYRPRQSFSEQQRPTKGYEYDRSPPWEEATSSQQQLSYGGQSSGRNRRSTEASWGEEGNMGAPISRRSTGLEVEDGRGRERRNPQRSYTYDSSPPRRTNDFEWTVEVRWDDPASFHPSFKKIDCQIRFDSGCDESNWVSERVVRLLAAPVIQLPNAAEFVAFNGKAMTGNYRTRLAFGIKGAQGYSTDFLVAAGDRVPFDLVLGALDSVRFGILSKPVVPSDSSTFLGLATRKMTKAEQKEEKEREAIQAEKVKEQRKKWKQMPTRKQVPSDAEVRRRPTR